MTKILDGKLVAEAIIQDCAQRVSEKISRGELSPKLSVVCVGDDDSNNSYLKGIEKKAADAGILFEVHQLSEDASKDDLISEIQNLNADDTVNGILLMRPLPASLRSFESEICEYIATEKDVDAAKKLSVAGAYLGIPAYGACTAESCMEILHYYDIDIEGKHAVVIGRSLVVGKPVGNLLLNENATVTICHSKTKNIEKLSKQADIVIVATRTPKKFGKKYFSEGQVVIDAGINFDESTGKLCGDVDFDAVSDKVAAITPVPGGVGSVTSAILIKHLLH